MEELQSRRGLAEAGITYSAGIVLYVIASLVLSVACVLSMGEGYASSAVYRWLAYLLPQVCFAAAALVFFRRSGLAARAVYRGCKPKYFLFALLLPFGLLFSLSELNTLFSDWLVSLGFSMPENTLPPLEGWYLLPALLVIAVLPALFEETIFRGILVGRMHAAGWGNAAVVLISGALFALYHGSPLQTVYQFLCGCCYALLALRAGSVLPTALSHLCNNAVILVLTATGYGDLTLLGQAWRIALIVLAALALAGTLVYLIFFDKNNAQKGGAKDGKYFFYGAGTGIAVCAVLWIANLVTGFSGG